MIAFLMVTNALTLGVLYCVHLGAEAMILYIKEKCTPPTSDEVRAYVRKAMKKEH